MKTRFKRLAGICFGIGVCFSVCCNCFSVEKNALDRAKVVARIKDINGNKVTVADFNAFAKKEVEIPLSMLVEDFQLVKLDNREEALVGKPFGNCPITISDHYILVGNHQQNPCKLFDKQGKYLATIGAYGKGPGEYNLIYDYIIDEEAGVIYIMPWYSQAALMYNLKGEFKAYVFMEMRPSLSVIWVDGDLVSRAMLANSESPAVAYQVKKTINSEVKGLPYLLYSSPLTSVVRPGPLAISTKYRGLNYNILTGRNTNAKDLYICRYKDQQADSLYHYSPVDSTLVPKFTVDFPDPVPLHAYAELPNHYVGELEELKNLSATVSEVGPSRYFMIDKKTLQGSFIQLVNDFLGKLKIKDPMWAFRNGYYVANYEPEELQEEIAAYLATSPSISEAMKKKLTDLQNSIGPNDNNYILYAKLKSL